MAQEVENLLSKQKALNSNSRSAEKGKKKFEQSTIL
jgi:hypothetical protein